MGSVDGLGYLANVFASIAFGADGVDVDVGLVFGGKAEFGFLEMEDLRPQEAGDRAIRIHGGLRRGGYFDDGHAFPLILVFLFNPYPFDPYPSSKSGQSLRWEGEVSRSRNVSAFFSRGERWS